MRPELIDSSSHAVNYAAMDSDENLPLRRDDPLAALARQDLDPLSVDELQARIATLKSEINRCEGKIAFAASHRDIADALFKK